MKRFLLSILFFVGVLSSSYSAVYRAISNGEWSNSSIWDVAPFDGSGGDGVPGSGDIALTNGFQISLNPANGDVTVDRITVDGSTQNSIFYDDPFFTFTPVTLNINLSLSSNSSPTTTVIENNPNLIVSIKGTGSSVINNWSQNATFLNLNFDSNGSTSVGSNIGLNNGDLSVSSGTVLTISGVVSDPNNNSNININEGASLIVNGGIDGDGTNVTRFNNVNILGNVTTGTTGYINSENFSLGSSSTFTINFNGANQTQGWWYDNVGPTGTFNIDPASTIIYNASANQNVGALEYGNLTLRSPSSASVKSLQSTNNLVVQGLLRINSANVTFNTSTNSNPINIEGNIENLGDWSASQLVIFSGTSAQSINGSNPIAFDGGIRVSNTTGLSLNNVGIDVGTELDIDPSCSFDPSDQVVTMSGNMRIDGDLIAGTNPGGFLFDGTTEFLGGGNRAFYNVEIDAAGTLTAPSGTITVERNWTNDGVFDSNLGTVVFSNTDPVSISGGSNSSFFNLAAEGSTVNIDGPVDLENIMTFAGSPTVDFDGSGSGVFTLKSTETRDAAIDNIGSATLQGVATVERAIYNVRGDGKGYHLMSFPLSGVTVADVQNEIGITGGFTGASTGYGSADGYASVFAYNETAGGGINDRFVDFPSTDNTETFDHGVGYHVFTFAGETPVVVDGTGTFFTGDFDIPITLTPGPTAADGGWNLIANPYPAPTDWGAWTKPAELEAGAAHIYNVSSEMYEVTTDGTIPQGQAFYVRATGNATLSATEATKVTGTTPTFFRESEPEKKFKIALDNGDFEDITYVGFKQGATDAYESTYDASRFLNYVETISTLSNDGKKLKINQMAKTTENSCQRSIFISLEKMKAGKDYALNFYDVDLVQQYDFSLTDHYLGKTITIDNATSYDFTVNSDAASKGQGRFEVIFNSKAPSSVSVTANDVCPNQNGVLNIQNTDDFANYMVYAGEEVVGSGQGNGSEISVEILNEFLNSSTNAFDIKAFVEGCDTVAVGNAQIQVKEELSFDSQVLGSSICKVENQAAFRVSTQLGASYYILDNADTIQTFQGNGTVFEGFISSANLQDGLNEFIIAASKDGCQEGTLNQSLEITVENLTIDESVTFAGVDACYKSSTDIVFNSQANVEYHLYKNDVLIKSVTGNGTEQLIEVSESNLSVGLNEFSISATYGDCAEYDFVDPIEINVEENINKNLSLITENTCGDSNSVIIIENAQAGKQYSVMKGDESLSSLTATKDGELTFTLNSNQVKTGLNTLDIQIDGENCGTQISSNQAVFTVEESVNTNLEYTAENSCGAENAIIGITNPQIGKVYQLYSGETLIESKEATDGAELIFDLVREELTVGQNTFDVKVVSNICGVKDASQSISLEVYESINSDLTISSSDVCAGSNAVIEILNPQIGKTYRLMEAETAIATKRAESLETVSFSIPSDGLTSGNHILSVDIIDDNCGALTANQTVEFEVFSSAVIENIENQEICLNDNVQIDLVSNVPMSNYQLYIGEELVQEEASSSLSLSPEETTTYTLTGTPESGCEINSVTFTVEVTDLAKPGILVSGNVLESSVEGDRYQWYLNGARLEDETGKLIVTTESGDYKVEVIKANCSILSDSFTFNEEILNANKELENALSVFPNPVEDKLFVELNNISSINITILTISGKFIDNFVLKSGQSEVDMTKFSKGTYIIQFESDKGIVSKRIVKQ